MAPCKNSRAAAASRGWHRQSLAQGEKKTSVSLIYEAIAATNATLWLAEDARLFEKYGLDAKVVHARGAIPVQALVSGSVEFGAFSGSSAIAAVLGGSDLKSTMIRNFIIDPAAYLNTSSAILADLAQ